MEDQAFPSIQICLFLFEVVQSYVKVKYHSKQGKLEGDF